MTIKEKYDAVIPNFGGTNFTAYYIKGQNLKLSNGSTVINIWKPGQHGSVYKSGEVYKDAMFDLSGSSTLTLNYTDIKKLMEAIDMGIDYLNQENENIIDRDKEATYETTKRKPDEPKTTKAIPYKELEIGGIYLDEKEKAWVFLGEGLISQKHPVTEQEVSCNRSNDGKHFCKYIYMPYYNYLGAPVAEIGPNEFAGQISPDSYASKKRFFKKVGQLNVDVNMPIICPYHKVYVGINPDLYHWVIPEDIMGMEKHASK